MKQPKIIRKRKHPAGRLPILAPWHHKKRKILNMPLFDHHHATGTQCRDIPLAWVPESLRAFDLFMRCPATQRSRDHVAGRPWRKDPGAILLQDLRHALQNILIFNANSRIVAWGLAVGRKQAFVYTCAERPLAGGACPIIRPFTADKIAHNTIMSICNQKGALRAARGTFTISSGVSLTACLYALRCQFAERGLSGVHRLPAVIAAVQTLGAAERRAGSRSHRRDACVSAAHRFFDAGSRCQEQGSDTSQGRWHELHSHSHSLMTQRGEGIDTHEISHFYELGKSQKQKVVLLREVKGYIDACLTANSLSWSSIDIKLPSRVGR